MSKRKANNTKPPHATKYENHGMEYYKKTKQSELKIYLGGL